MTIYTFYVGNEKWLELEEASASDAMAKANRFLPEGFYGWLDVGPDSFSAMFGAWD